MRHRLKGCSHPGCQVDGLFKVENELLCAEHLTEQVASFRDKFPEIVAMEEAEEEFRCFVEDGGKPS